MTADLTQAEIGLIRDKIKEKYAGVATSGAGGCFGYPTGIDGLRKLGYPEDILRQLPPAVLAPFCGVGNPFSLGPVYPGDAVLDLGCGAGADSLIAAVMAGPRGRVTGIDVTPEMVAKAQENLAATGLGNVSFEVAEAESLPFPDDSFDAVISNGVINLTVDKEKVLREAHRVLKPGGRLMVADMVLVSALPEERGGRLENWFQWIGGAIPGRDFLALLLKAGFLRAGLDRYTGFKTSPYTEGALFYGEKAVAGEVVRVRAELVTEPAQPPACEPGSA